MDKTAKMELIKRVNETAEVMQGLVDVLLENFPELLDEEMSTTEKEEKSSIVEESPEEISALLVKHNMPLEAAREFSAQVIESGYSKEVIEKAINAGFTNDELALVVSSQLPVEDCLEWKSKGFEALDEEFKLWYASFDAVEEALEWKSAGFKPDSAVEWLIAANTVAEAQQWKSKEFDPVETSNWRAAEISDVDAALAWKQAGVSPAEAKVFTNQGIKPEDVKSGE